MLKTQYFTKTNISQSASEMYHSFNDQFKLHKDKLNITKAALLILDMQKFFNNEESHAFVPSAKAIVEPITSLAELFRKNNRPIIVTRHINTKQNAKQMDYWWRDLLTEESAFSELIPEIDTSASEIIIKSQYDAFYNTNLKKVLNINNIEQVVITGVMTHLCCETTARSAFIRGYNVFFPIDGTATYNEVLHLSSLTNLAHGFANITTISKLNEQIGK